MSYLLQYLHSFYKFIINTIALPLLKLQWHRCPLLHAFNMNDLDFPIALHQGKKSTTTHPISNFVYYNYLTSKYHVFITSVFHLFLFLTYHEAMLDPMWKLAKDEKMKILPSQST